MDNSYNRVLSFQEGCKYLGYAKSYVYKMLSAGIIPYSKPNGKKIFFDKQILEFWMLSNVKTSKAHKEIISSTYISIKSGIEGQSESGLKANKAEKPESTGLKVFLSIVSLLSPLPRTSVDLLSQRFNLTVFRLTTLIKQNGGQVEDVKE
jgi:excisionase family DNA binding protein